MSGVNKCMFIGNVGNNLQVRDLENGTTVANFSLAVSEAFRDKTTQEKRQETTWLSVCAWKATAQSIRASQLAQGDRIFLEGKLRNKTRKDKDGNEKKSVEIVADNFVILSRKKVSIPETTSSIEDDF